MDSIGERLKSYWYSRGVAVRPGAPQKSVKSFQDAYDVSLPGDLNHYYRLVDGMEEGDTDDCLLHFFPLRAVKTVAEELVQFGGIPDYRPINETLPNPEHCFVFADYLIRSHVYAIRLSRDPFAGTPIIWICGAAWQVVAATFSEFGEKYFAKREELLMPL